MGGFNSGGGRGALRTDYFLKLDLASLKRLKMMRPGSSGSMTWTRGSEAVGTIGLTVLSDRVRLSYRHKPYGGDWEEISETIFLTGTDAGFGGRRKWFVCPSCSRRVRILYGGRLYRCRKCRGATYESQYDPHFHACHNRIRRLRKRLRDFEGDTWAPLPVRPKGMHRSTYAELSDAIWCEQMNLDRGIASYIARKFPGYLE